jgi:hypothetical protein
MNPKKTRWWVRLVLTLAVGASIAGNVLHAQPNTVARLISAWSPTALLLTVELISRVPQTHSRWLAATRRLATALIAGIAAVVSYGHMLAVAARYGESHLAATLLPLSVDGLVVVASVCLVELGVRIRAAEGVPVDAPAEGGEPSPLDAYTVAVAAQTALGAALEPAGELTDPGQSATVPDGTPRRRRGGRKLPPSSAPDVAKILRRNPDATPAQIAVKVGISESTARRHRDAILPPTASAPEEINTPVGVEINGRSPVLAATSEGVTP